MSSPLVLILIDPIDTHTYTHTQTLQSTHTQLKKVSENYFMLYRNITLKIEKKTSFVVDNLGILGWSYLFQPFLCISLKL